LVKGGHDDTVPDRQEADVPDDAGARYWAGRIAVAVGWPQEVHRFPHRIALRADTHSEALS